VVSDRELDALIRLLDDPDEDVYRNVADRLFGLGTDVIPHLEAAWTERDEPGLQPRIEHLVQRIQADAVRRDFAEWLRDDGEDLLEAGLILDRFAFPGRDPMALREAVSDLRRAIWLELNHYLNPLEKIHVINQVLYQHRGFDGLEALAREPKASALGSVLETRKGNPLSMGLLYLILAQQLELPVYGVPFPQHPLLAVTDGYLHDFERTDLREQVVFYCYPFRAGAVVTARDIDDNLNRAGVAARPEYYLPVPNRAVIHEYLHIWRGQYVASGEEDRASDLTDLLALFGDEELPASGREPEEGPEDAPPF
jgi:hypothetical protein